ncbi:mitochondrial 39-S ribosomal protein L47 (MRP-L47)-domain-containing protein [Lentinula aff. detonsa]|uniref:Large ribosomal subunit protein uL29m n=1 Tax=Lentinula aff. detonsa TaxID=2804958 RepID=A0AA38U8K8_9AGAR|nr:mitochondrial 39-S ribosomal protein L47 (MRP-L47)-domain-containing protein [Lentinula aff. detonsa]KAJ3801532.1 mitochondrial 39-S ribosomal protein L47 (MRP-L47)-domain-containing protein [Lentinula aff. detonsa]
MLTLLRRSYGSRPRLLTRSFAEVVPVTSQPSAPQPLKGTIDPPPTHAIASPDGNNSASNAEPKIVAPVRLGNRVPVRADHGLYAFFRLKEPAAGQTLKGEAQYETLGGTIEMDRTRSSRAWKASELRLKSFEDLHTLWYILLRERNLLATQEEEVRRLGATKVVLAFNTQVRACRKSMARIKYVMNERRLAYEGALKLAEEEKTAHITNLVLKQQLAEHQKERELFRRQKRARIRAAREAKRKAEQARKEIHVAEVQSSVKEQDIVTAEPDSIDKKIDAPEATAQHPQSIKTGTAQSAQTIEKPEQTPKARSSPVESASEAATAGLFGTRGRRR